MDIVYYINLDRSKGPVSMRHDSLLFLINCCTIHVTVQQTVLCWVGVVAYSRFAACSFLHVIYEQAYTPSGSLEAVDLVLISQLGYCRFKWVSIGINASTCLEENRLIRNVY